MDAGAGRRRARHGSADVPASESRGAQAPAARGAEAGQATGLAPRPRGGSLSRDATAPGVNSPPRKRPGNPQAQLTQATPAQPTPSCTSPPASTRLRSSIFLRIHRISFLASLLHITHSCTYWCARPYCVTKKPRRARQAQITPRDASVNLRAVVGSGWKGSCIGGVGPQTQLGHDRVDILGQGRTTPSNRLSGEGPPSEWWCEPAPVVANRPGESHDDRP